ncbi:MAG: ChaN family lipoprotein [Rhodobacter sp.]|nr:ChaN family lipoprotein [Rhodobacter sp.]
MMVRFLLAAAMALPTGGLAWAEPRRIEPAELAELPAVDVVILGEVHDNPGHHDNQAMAVQALGARALVFEMLTEAQALRISPGVPRNAQELEKTLGWADSGWPDFEFYYPIFVAVDAPAIFGGALDRSVVRAAVDSGAAAAFGGAAALFGLTNALDDHEQTARESGQMAAHCDALPIPMLPGIVEAQRLRDAALARAVIAAFAETGGPVAVITGNGHARRDWGIPRALELAAPDLEVLSVGQFESAPEGDIPFDFWLLTDPAEREDPCAGFSVK